MNISPAWINVEVQERIKHQTIPLIKKDPPEANEYDIIKIMMRQIPSDAAWKTYKLKMVTFEHVQSEEFLQLMKNFKRAVDGTVTTTAAGKINYLRTLLSGKHFESLTN